MTLLETSLRMENLKGTTKTVRIATLAISSARKDAHLDDVGVFWPRGKLDERAHDRKRPLGVGNAHHAGQHVDLAD